MNDLANLKCRLTIRLEMAQEQFDKLGVIPGLLDTTELEQLFGRIKEIKHILKMIDITH